ncbi:hypothetical protein RHGRI_006914 [Rhododendron griersonianum]|uniref:Uncharacterized protein n=1 Tax=Rhododendron griersonianum TaxID=479676 RepID=A0AAV6KWG8_9ERIC|nr:hypothetical protein RHGRI_006914 [Rhododendron griersonianum]
MLSNFQPYVPISFEELSFLEVDRKIEVYIARSLVWDPIVFELGASKVFGWRNKELLTVLKKAFANHLQGLILKYFNFRSPILSVAASFAVGLLGLLPTQASRFLVRHSVGKSWCTSAVEALCTHVLQYHVMRNVLFLAMTEFKKVISIYSVLSDCLSKYLTRFSHYITNTNPVADRGPRTFRRRRHRRRHPAVSSANDALVVAALVPSQRLPRRKTLVAYRALVRPPTAHGGNPARSSGGRATNPFDISSNVPGAALAVEREGHSHAFSCSTAGSLWWRFALISIWLGRGDVIVTGKAKSSDVLHFTGTGLIRR